MEILTLRFPGSHRIRGRALTGIVSSGDLEVLMSGSEDEHTRIRVTTSVDGSERTWQAVLGRIFGQGHHPALSIEIHDAGATPGVIRLRIEQALEEVARHARPE